MLQQKNLCDIPMCHSKRHPNGGSRDCHAAGCPGAVRGMERHRENHRTKCPRGEKMGKSSATIGYVFYIYIYLF